VREADIADFWDTHPCGEAIVDGLRGDYDRFFTEYDRVKYQSESHIPRCIGELGVEGKRVLEIGLGQGAESELLIRAGASWSGIDLTQESVERVRTRLALRGLQFEELLPASVLSLPFQDASFDLVFSHGVLHHVPDIRRAQMEIHRVLRAEGKLVVMLYAKRSLNYAMIATVRRLAVAVAYPLRRFVSGGMLEGHLRNAESAGLGSYLRMDEFINRNTDGPDNPYSQVYTLNEVRNRFPLFRIVRTQRHFMHAPPLPVHRLPGESVLGWHLWAYLRPTSTGHLERDVVGQVDANGTATA
jgi:SAM-dependent methyltransferase